MSSRATIFRIAALVNSSAYGRRVDCLRSRVPRDLRDFRHLQRPGHRLRRRLSLLLFSYCGQDARRSLGQPKMP